MARDVQITIDAHDPRGLAGFWQQALGYEYPLPPGVSPEPGRHTMELWDDFLERIGMPPEQRNSSCALEDPEGRGPRIFFQQVPESKSVKNRLHLDVRAAPGLTGEERMASLETESERLVALGATRLERFEPGGMNQGHLVMTDPEGNEFCLD